MEYSVLNNVKITLFTEILYLLNGFTGAENKVNNPISLPKKVI